MQRKEETNKDEYAKTNVESSKSIDNPVGGEQNTLTTETLSTTENNDTTITTKLKTRNDKKKANKRFNHIFGAIAAVVTAVAVVAILPKPAPTITPIDSVIGGDYYAYNLTIDNPSDIDLQVVVYNDYYKKETQVKNGNIKGLVEGLAPNTDYKIAVNGSQGFGKKAFFSAKFRTKDTITKFVTAVSAKYYKKAGEQSLFYKVEVNDFFTYYTNYKVFMEIKGFVKEVPIVGSITDEQSFSLSDIKARNVALRITADTTAPQDIAEGKTNITVYSANVRTEEYISK